MAIQIESVVVGLGQSRDDDGLRWGTSLSPFPLQRLLWLQWPILESIVERMETRENKQVYIKL